MITVKCQYCGKEFKIKKCQIKSGRGKFCSRDCYYLGRIIWNKGKTNVWSEESLQKMSRKGSKASSETRIKMSMAHKGSNCNFWKGGVTPIHDAIRKSIEYKLWREAIFARDNWTCQKTGIKGGTLRAHHIQNFAQFPELRFAIDNGITLSKESHNEFHKLYGIKNNTKEQLEEFLNNEQNG
jgi:endogenous inhibitor of DNA gyrase (YacG/DUF329 family)